MVWVDPHLPGVGVDHVQTGFHDFVAENSAVCSSASFRVLVVGVGCGAKMMLKRYRRRGCLLAF